jgi:hypothetical protein
MRRGAEERYAGHRPALLFPVDSHVGNFVFLFHTDDEEDERNTRELTQALQSTTST